MARIKSGFVSGTVDDNPLTNSATTLNSTELSDLPVVSSPDVAAIILDPEGSAGAPEIVHVTAHTASATSATIERGKEGTTARQHALNTAWVHGPTTQDFVQTKEFLVPPGQREGSTFPLNAVSGNWALASLASLEELRSVFLVPHDFNLLDKAEILIIPDASEIIQWDILSSYGAPGELSTTHSDSVTDDTQSVTSGEIEALDISGVLSNLAANDVVALLFRSKTSSIRVIGTRIKYV